VYILAGIPALVTLLVFWQGSIAAGPSTPSVSDKLVHFVAFGGLALSCVPFASAMAKVRAWSEVQRLAFCFGYATVVGGLLELWQATLPHRSAEWMDFVADAGGAAVASGIVWLLVPRTRH
jgi:VanZ family protein